MMYQLNTTKFYYVYYCIRATCFDSYRIIFRPFYDTDPYLGMIGFRNNYLDLTIRTLRHVHLIHSFIKNVSVWDPTAHFKHR